MTALSKYFIVSVDVEIDKSPNWSTATPTTFSGVKHGIKEILHPLFMKYGVRPTYLLSPEVISLECCKIFLELNNC